MVAVFFIATLVKGVFSGDGQKSSSEFAMPNLVGMDFNQAHEAYPNLDIQVEATEWSDLERIRSFLRAYLRETALKR